MDFCEVLDVVREWISTATGKRRISVDVTRNTDAALRAFFESTDCVGELMVAEPECAPYRFVSFQILRMDETPVFCYYDSEISTLREIVDKLDAGLDMM